ncbi:putative sulfate transporter 3.4-like [Capsicum annuum]|nr:putative sulfate transporter 3.4-like [Capsicum annuum]
MQSLQDRYYHPPGKREDKFHPLPVFPSDLPRIPLDKEIDFEIDLLPETHPIFVPPYRMAQPELNFKKLKHKLTSTPVLTLLRGTDGLLCIVMHPVIGLCFDAAWLCVHDVEGLGEKILTEAHESIYTVHPHSAKMYHDLKEIYWWNNMKRDVANFIAKCLMAPFEDLYRRRYRSPIEWFDIGETRLFSPELVHQAIEKVKDVGVTDSLSYEKVLVEILDSQVCRLRTKDVSSVKVLWRNQKCYFYYRAKSIPTHHSGTNDPKEKDNDTEFYSLLSFENHGSTGIIEKLTRALDNSSIIGSVLRHTSCGFEGKLVGCVLVGKNTATDMFYGSAVWDPWLIVKQIGCLQCIYYLTLGMFLEILVGTCVSRMILVYFFDYATVTASTVTGWCVIASFLLSSLAG